MLSLVPVIPTVVNSAGNLRRRKITTSTALSVGAASLPIILVAIVAKQLIKSPFAMFPMHRSSSLHLSSASIDLDEYPESREEDAIAKRIWIIDNSISMCKSDSYRLVESRHRNKTAMVPCTRWEELLECLSYHIQFASNIKAPTSFRLLNPSEHGLDAQEFGIAENPYADAEKDAQEALKIIQKVKQEKKSNSLAGQMFEIRRIVSEMIPQLRRSGKYVAIIIATDSLPTDGKGHGGREPQRQFAESLRSLEGLPISISIRLSCDDDYVIGFYRALNYVVDLSVEVHTGFCEEAEEVCTANPWINYSLPLHRKREIRYHDHIFDKLRDGQLELCELREACSLLFDKTNFDGAPDPVSDWNGFVLFLKRSLRNEKQHWDPIKKKMKPSIDLSKLHKKCFDIKCEELLLWEDPRTTKKKAVTWGPPSNPPASSTSDDMRDSNKKATSWRLSPHSKSPGRKVQRRASASS